MYLFLAVLSLHCFAQAFSSRFGWGTSFVAVLGFLLLLGHQTPRAVAPVVVARGLGSCGSTGRGCEAGEDNCADENGL